MPDSLSDGFTPGMWSTLPPLHLQPPVLRGRESQLTALLAHMQNNAVVTLDGGVGAGKSTLALAVARTIEAEATNLVWWIDAADDRTPKSVLFKEIAAAAVRHVHGDGPSIFGDAWSHCTDRPDLLWELLERVSVPWLLVVDNLDVPSSEWSPWLRAPVSPHGTVLITTTHKAAWDQPAARHRVEPLDRESAAAVLLDLAPHAGNVEQARHLADDLAGSPLALSLAGRYLAWISRAPVLPGRLPRTFTEYSADATTAPRSRPYLPSWALDIVDWPAGIRSSLARYRR